MNCPESLVRTGMWTGAVLPFFVSVAESRGRGCRVRGGDRLRFRRSCRTLFCAYASQDKVGGAEIGGDILSGAHENSALAAQIAYVDVDIHSSRSPRRLALKFGDTVVVCGMATE
jgi:hypothetical protein